MMVVSSAAPPVPAPAIVTGEPEVIPLMLANGMSVAPTAMAAPVVVAVGGAPEAPGRLIDSGINAVVPEGVAIVRPFELVTLLIDSMLPAEKGGLTPTALLVRLNFTSAEPTCTGLADDPPSVGSVVLMVAE